MGVVTKIEVALMELLGVRDRVFYASLLLQMVRFEDKTCPTMGVCIHQGRIQLFYNPEFVEKISLDELISVLEHECLHVVMDHFTRGKYLDKGIFNIAADMAINQLIEGLPKGVVLPQQFNLPENKFSEYYYLELLKQAVKICISLPDKNGKGGGRITIETPRGKKYVVDDHGKWGVGDGIGEELRKEIIRQAIKQAAEAQADRGYMPGALRELIDAWIRPPVISWKRILRLFVGNQIKAGTKSSWKRLSRRFGECQKGRLPMRTLKLIIAIDTSGSIGKEEFQEFIAEIRGIQKCYQNETRIIECDAKVQKEYILTPFTKLDTKFAGRGGTEYEPVFNRIKEARYNPDLLIYLTDFQCTFPKEKPNYGVLWAVTSKGDLKNTPPWGFVLSMKKSGGTSEK